MRDTGFSDESAIFGSYGHSLISLHHSFNQNHENLKLYKSKDKREVYSYKCLLKKKKRIGREVRMASEQPRALLLSGAHQNHSNVYNSHPWKRLEHSLPRHQK